MKSIALKSHSLKSIKADTTVDTTRREAKSMASTSHRLFILSQPPSPRLTNYLLSEILPRLLEI